MEAHSELAQKHINNVHQTHLEKKSFSHFCFTSMTHYSFLCTRVVLNISHQSIRANFQPNDYGMTGLYDTLTSRRALTCLSFCFYC